MSKIPNKRIINFKMVDTFIKESLMIPSGSIILMHNTSLAKDCESAGYKFDRVLTDLANKRIQVRFVESKEECDAAPCRCVYDSVNGIINETGRPTQRIFTELGEWDKSGLKEKEFATRIGSKSGLHISTEESGQEAALGMLYTLLLAINKNTVGVYNIGGYDKDGKPKPIIDNKGILIEFKWVVDCFVYIKIFIGILNDPKSFRDARNIKNISLGVDYSLKLLRYLDTLLPNYIEKVNQCVNKLGIDSIKKVDKEDNSSTLEDPVVYPDENQRFLNNFMHAFLHNEGSIGTVITAYQLPEDLFMKFGEEDFPTKISKKSIGGGFL